LSYSPFEVEAGGFFAPQTCFLVAVFQSLKSYFVLRIGILQSKRVSSDTECTLGLSLLLTLDSEAFLYRLCVWILALGQARVLEIF
jgi:hypothetical protein